MNTTTAMPVCRIEQPPRGPNHETDDEFQRRVDELLAYRTPWWRDAAFVCLVTGVFCLALSATLWLMG
jgi:hypothetical protein